MKKILFIFGVMCLLSLPAFGQVYYGTGSPLSASPVPNCNSVHLYIDGSTGNAWASQGLPCTWVQQTGLVPPPTLLYPTNVPSYSFLSGANLTYPLDEGTGSTANDISGSGFTGTWSGTQAGSNGYYDVGIIGPFAGHFDGATNGITLPSSSDLNYNYTQPWTIAAWIKSTSNTGQDILAKVNPNSPFPGYAFDLQANGELSEGMISTYSTNMTQVCSSEPVNDGNWHFVAVTNDGSGTLAGQILYIDGYVPGYEASVSTCGKSTLSASILNTYAAQVGEENNSAFFNGDIDNVQMFASVLSASQMQAMYALEAPGYANQYASVDKTWFTGNNITNDNQATCFFGSQVASGTNLVITAAYNASPFTCMSTPSTNSVTHNYETGAVYNPTPFLYGHFRVKMEMAPWVASGGAQNNTAFWLQGMGCLPNPLAHFGTVAACGYGSNFLSAGYEEVDLAEYGFHGVGVVGQNVYSHTDNAQQTASVSTAVTAFHDYDAWWTPSGIVFGVDGAITSSYSTTQFQAPMFMWFTSNIGSGASPNSASYPVTASVACVEHWNQSGVADWYYAPGNPATTTPTASQVCK